MKQLRDRVQQALIYPAFLVLAGIGLIIIFITVMVPQLNGVFRQHQRRDAAAADPDADRRRTMLFVQYWWLAVAGGIGRIRVVQALTRSPAGRLAWDRMRLGVPGFGAVLQLQFLRAVRPHDGHAAAKRRHAAAHDGTAGGHVGQHVPKARMAEHARAALVDGSSLSSALTRQSRSSRSSTWT